MKSPEGVYIVGLGQYDFVEPKFAMIGSMKQKVGPTTWALFCASWHSPLTSSSLVLPFPKK
jgi:hypothetical protein